MSQEKVDINKQKKYNRKKLVKQQKIKKAVTITALSLVAAVLIGWVAYSVYNRYETAKSENIEKYTIDSSALSDYISSLSEEE